MINIVKKIAIGCDRAGFPYKDEIIKLLHIMNFEVIDFGTNDDIQVVDYTEYAKKVANAILNKEAEMGVLICGTGIGMAMMANRYNTIRAGVCHNEFTAQATRAHNDANIITLGARVIDLECAKSCVHKFFTTDFEGGRHLDRVNNLKRSSY